MGRRTVGPQIRSLLDLTQRGISAKPCTNLKQGGGKASLLAHNQIKAGSIPVPATTMKKLILLLVMLAAPLHAEQLTFTIPDGVLLGSFVTTLICDSSGTIAPVVDCGTHTLTTPAISSGPFMVWVGPGTKDCYRYLRANPNGSLVPDLSAGPNGYLRCPE